MMIQASNPLSSLAIPSARMTPHPNPNAFMYLSGLASGAPVALLMGYFVGCDPLDYVPYPAVAGG